jgi:hypothetical protein
LRKERSAVSEKSRQLVADFQKQINAVLTTQQLASYRRMAVHNLALGVFNDIETLWKMGVTKEQAVALEQLQGESFEKPEQIAREFADKAIQTLTPAQQEILREEVNRQPW